MDWFLDLLRPELNRGAPAAPAEGLILMDVGYEGLIWNVDRYSLERAASALASTVQRKKAKAEVAREMQRAMESGFQGFLL